MTTLNIRPYIRNVPDFPKPGIQFKDITTLLAAPEAMNATFEQLHAQWRGIPIDAVAGIESRGFMFGIGLAQKLNVGFIPIRKPGKLPAKTFRIDYALEYGTDALEIHQDAVAPGKRILIVDDLLATGGTMRAACQLIEKIGGHVVGCAVVVELGFLPGRRLLEPFVVKSLVNYDAE